MEDLAEGIRHSFRNRARRGAPDLDEALVLRRRNRGVSVGARNRVLRDPHRPLVPAGPDDHAARPDRGGPGVGARRIHTRPRRGPSRKRVGPRRRRRLPGGIRNSRGASAAVQLHPPDGLGHAGNHPAAAKRDARPGDERRRGADGELPDAAARGGDGADGGRIFRSNHRAACTRRKESRHRGSVHPVQKGDPRAVPRPAFGSEAGSAPRFNSTSSPRTSTR
jgi:hypothetical protein